MFCEVIRNCCSLTTLSLLRDSAIGSEKWHFKYPAGVPLEEKHPKLDIIDGRIKEEFLFGLSCAILTNVYDQGGKDYFHPHVFYCGISIKDKYRKDNTHTDHEDIPNSIKVLGILNDEWKEEWGGGFIHGGNIVRLNPGDFCIFDPRVPHAAEDITTDIKRLALDFSVRSIT